MAKLERLRFGLSLPQIDRSTFLTGAKLPDNAGEDSVSFAPALQGKPIVSTRKGVVHHSVSGRFAYREEK